MLTLIQGMATHMVVHAQEEWNHLNNMTTKIFEHYENEVENQMDKFRKNQEEANQK